MRVYYSSNEYIDFPTATHWSYQDPYWVELSDDNEQLVAVLSWRNVWLIKML